MKKLSIAVFILLLISFVVPVTAQVILKVDPNNVMDMPELKIILLLRDGKVQVEFAPPVEERPKAYRDVDIQEKDEILMANGKKMKEMKDLKDIYKALKPGETLKMAIQRGDEKRMVSFNKASEEDLPKGKKIMMKVDESGNKKVIKSENVDEKELEKIIKKAEIKKEDKEK